MPSGVYVRSRKKSPSETAKYGRDIGKKPANNIFHLVHCLSCGKSRWLTTHRIKTHNYQDKCITCSIGDRNRNQRGILNPRWRGGRFKAGEYIAVTLQPEDFFYSMTSFGHVPEHRLIMAKHLNRCLLGWEVVHHKNGIKNDNRIENLQLLSSRTHHLADTVLKRFVSKLQSENEKLRREIAILKQVSGS